MLLLTPACKDNNLAPVITRMVGYDSVVHGDSAPLTVWVEDPETGNAYVRFDWDDGNVTAWLGPVASGGHVTQWHTWPVGDTYIVKAQARDAKGKTSAWGDHKLVVVGNRAPVMFGEPMNVYQPFVYVDSLGLFVMPCYDLDGDSLRFRADLGNGDTGDWSGWYLHDFSWVRVGAWPAPDTCWVRFQAQDPSGALSNWSESFLLWAVPASPVPRWVLRMDGDFDASSPALGADGTVYIGSLDNHIYAVAPDGSLRWKYLTDNEVRASPAVGPDGTIYCCSDSELLALNPDGTLRWQAPAGVAGITCPAIAADGAIVVAANDDTLRCFNADGSRRWSYAYDHGHYSSPVIAGDGTIYVSGRRALYALTPDGTLKWSCYEVSGTSSSPAIGSDGTVYVDGDGLCAVDPDGSLRWRADYRWYDVSSPTIAPDGTIYVPSCTRSMVALNPDGTVRWGFSPGRGANHSTAVASDGTLYVPGTHGHLCALNPDGTIKWVYVTSGGIWSSPTIAPDGTVYFATSDGLLHAIPSGVPPAASAWPKFQHDARNSGRAGGP